MYVAPGSSSKTSVDLTSSHSSTFGVDIYGSGTGVDASWEASISSSTSIEVSSTAVLAKLFKVTWHVYNYITPRRSYLKFIFVRAEEDEHKLGLKSISFDNLDTYHIYATDLTGQPGNYQFSTGCTAGGSTRITLKYEFEHLVNFKLGFEMTYDGMKIRHAVYYKDDSVNGLQISYLIKDDHRKVDCTMNSNAPFDSPSAPQVIQDGISIWFS